MCDVFGTTGWLCRSIALPGDDDHDTSRGIFGRHVEEQESPVADQHSQSVHVRW